MTQIEMEFEEFLRATIKGTPLSTEQRRVFYMCFLAGGAATIGMLKAGEVTKEAARILGEEIRQAAKRLRYEAPSRVIPL